LIARLLDALLLTERSCLHCGKTFKPETQGYLCRSCLLSVRPAESFYEPPELPGLDGLEYFALYEGALREAVKLIKFKSVKPLACELAERFRRHLKSYLDELGVPFVTFVPTHFLRRWRRGFDHNELMLKCAGLPALKLLKRVRYARPLAGAKKEERERRVRDAFKALGTLERVVLFDDVLTTGSTAVEAARVLKAAGVKEVYLYALALEPPAPLPPP